MRALVRCCPASGYARHFTGGGSVYRGTRHQRGYGVGSVYKGIPHQRGHGFGSFMKGLFRKAIPLIKQGASVLGKSAMKTAANVMSDVVEGRNIGESFGSRVEETGRDLMKRTASTLKEQSGGGRHLRFRPRSSLKGIANRTSPKIKKKCCRKRKQSKKKTQTARVSKEALKGDIFNRVF